ncbi:S-layer homology domain-containing protein [Patescibacteria group bacterium]
MKMIAVLFLLVSVGCGSRSVGHNNNVNDNNTNENTNVNDNTNVNTNTGPECLTFRIMVNDTVEEELEYEQDFTRPCLLDYLDVEISPEWHRLCHNMMILADIRAPQEGYPDGTLKPDECMLKAEVWHMQLRTLGLIMFPQGAPGDDVDQSDWYAGAIGNFARKGFITPDDDNMVYPADIMTLEEWNVWKSHMIAWLNMGLIRIDFLEVLLTSLLSGPTYDVLDCVSEEFDDIETNSFECVLTNTAIDYGLIDGYQMSFRPLDSLNWAEMVKMSMQAKNIPDSENFTCWNHCDEGEWYCGSINAACELGLLPPGLTNAGDIPTRLEAFRFLQLMEMLNL